MGNLASHDFGGEPELTPDFGWEPPSHRQMG